MKRKKPWKSFNQLHSLYILCIIAERQFSSERGLWKWQIYERFNFDPNSKNILSVMIWSWKKKANLKNWQCAIWQWGDAAKWHYFYSTNFEGMISSCSISPCPSPHFGWRIVWHIKCPCSTKNLPWPSRLDSTILAFCFYPLICLIVSS